MKSFSPILFALTLAGGLGLSNSASAQSNLNRDDGIAASPRLRQMLDERKATYGPFVSSPANAVTVVSSEVTLPGNLAASPKAREMLAQRQVVTVPVTTEIANAPAGYSATRAGGITASPKLQQQLEERGTTFMVAPVK